MGGSFLFLALSAWFALFAEVYGPPSASTVRKTARVSEATLLDRLDRPLHVVRSDRALRRLAWVPLEKIASNASALLVAAEDRRFYGHRGVDPIAIGRAVVRRWRRGEKQGASTLSMQLASLIEPRVRPRGSLSFGRKFAQAALAIAIEQRWTKAQILEAYWNLAPFRGEVSGVGAASRLFFRKGADGLQVPEAAVLVAMLRSPNAAPSLVARRAAALLGRVGQSAAIEEVETLAFRTAGPLPPVPAARFAPHLAGKWTLRPGVSVPTTVDRDLQVFVSDILSDRVRELQHQNVRDAAAIVIENSTGAVRAYVGGTGDLSSARFVDGAAARRQAGSTLKPFLYGMALERKLLTTASLLQDSPVDVPGEAGSYRPSNYDDTFRGAVTVREALASSLNVPAVRATLLVGVDRLVERLNELGLRDLERADFYGPSIALGSVDVRLVDLAAAYRVFATGGVYSPLVFRRDEVSAAPRRVFSQEAAFLVGNILSDRSARAPTFGLENLLATRSWSAVKTGTSKDMRDNWCMGWTERYTVGVWVGNFSGAPMWDVSGVSGAAPAWAAIVRRLHQDEPSHAPEPPSGVVWRAGEWFLQGTEPISETVAWEAVNRPIARIEYPAQGMVVAVDPDIPKDRQRVPIRARGAAGLRWRLDDHDIGPSDREIAWEPRPGRYRLALVDRSGVVKDSVSFSVRGN